jgi:membrane protein DedA with SNARE-associated domain
MECGFDSRPGHHYLNIYMLDSFISTLLSLVDGMGYMGVFLLMTVESSFLPFPSELVVPPAGYLASKGDFVLGFVILAGILGSLSGALINYFLALYLGKPLAYKLAGHKFAKYLLIDKEKLEKSEKLFKKHGAISTFFGRLIPVVRQLISIPAGFARMNLPVFLFWTGLGSGIWVVILALLGYYFGENTELLSNYYHSLKYFVFGVFLFVSLVFVLKFLKKRH